MFLGDGVRSILHEHDTREGAGVNGPNICVRVDRSKAFIVGYMGSTPVLKIALPSSPLPEHRLRVRWTV